MAVLSDAKLVLISEAFTREPLEKVWTVPVTVTASNPVRANPIKIPRLIRNPLKISFSQRVTSFWF